MKRERLRTEGMRRRMCEGKGRDLFRMKRRAFAHIPTTDGPAYDARGSQPAATIDRVKLTECASERGPTDGGWLALTAAGASP